MTIDLRHKFLAVHANSGEEYYRALRMWLSEAQRLTVERRALHVHSDRKLARGGVYDSLNSNHGRKGILIVPKVRVVDA